MQFFLYGIFPSFIVTGLCLRHKSGRQIRDPSIMSEGKLQCTTKKSAYFPPKKPLGAWVLNAFPLCLQLSYSIMHKLEHSIRIYFNTTVRIRKRKCIALAFNPISFNAYTFSSSAFIHAILHNGLPSLFCCAAEL